MLIRLDDRYTVAPSAVEMIFMTKEGWMNVYLKTGQVIYVDTERAKEVRLQLECN